MQYQPEFSERSDVYKFAMYAPSEKLYPKKMEMFFVPNNKGMYEFCTKNESVDERAVQNWMANVKRREVALEDIPYVIIDAQFVALKQDIRASRIKQIKESVQLFAMENSLKWHDKKTKKGPESIQVVGMAVEKYIETFDDYDGVVKDEALKYHLFVRDLKNKNKYVLTLYKARGMCGSGIQSETTGHLVIERWNKRKPFTHQPKEPLFIKGFSINPDSLCWKQERKDDRSSFIDDVDFYEPGYYLDDIRNNVFTLSEFGGDSYYPSGDVTVNMDHFRSLERAMPERPVWIIKGPSGTGKSTLAEHLEGLSVFETDGVDELPKTIYEDVIVLGNRSGFTVNDVKSRLFGHPNVLIVSFEQESRVPEREKSISPKGNRKFRNLSSGQEIG